MADNLFVNRHIVREYGKVAYNRSKMHQVSSLVPGVMAKTGMETAEIVKGVVAETEPDALIVIDALAARSTKRLNRTIQITNTGIQPGSGVGNHRNALTQESLGVPVIAIGIPTVVDAATIVNDALEKLLEWAEPQDTDEWLSRIREWDRENPLEMRRDKGMTPQMIMEQINEQFTEGVIVTDVGQHQMWAAQYIELNEKKQFITSGGLGTMGFGFPAAIGAKIGCPEKQVVCITGDGGMQMNLQELATAMTQGANVIVCILNNCYLGMVRQMQQLFYGKRYKATCLRRRKDCPNDCKGPNPSCPPYEPDFVKLAESYGAMGIRVTKEEEIAPAFEKAKEQKVPVFIEFMIAAEEIVLPMVKGGNPMTEMILK